MAEPCCIAAAHGQACTCRRADFWPVNMPRPECDWRAAWYVLDRENVRLRDALRMCASGSYTTMEKSRIAQGALDYREGE